MKEEGNILTSFSQEKEKNKNNNNIIIIIIIIRIIIIIINLHINRRNRLHHHFLFLNHHLPLRHQTMKPQPSMISHRINSLSLSLSFFFILPLQILQLFIQKFFRDGIVVVVKTHIEKGSFFFNFLDGLGEAGGRGEEGGFGEEGGGGRRVRRRRRGR